MKRLALAVILSFVTLSPALAQSTDSSGGQSQGQHHHHKKHKAASTTPASN